MEIVCGYLRIKTPREAAEIPRWWWTCVGEIVPLRERYDVTPAKREAYELLRHFEGAYARLDNAIFAELREVREPPAWSHVFVPGREPIWDWHQLGDCFSIYLPRPPILLPLGGRIPRTPSGVRRG